ncbi:MAG: pilus assembly protein PilM [Sedimentisphaerales bacterium]
MISWKLKTRSVRPIGLDIGHNSIKMIQLAINEGRISVLAADKVRLDPNIDGDGEERRGLIVSTIKQMLTESNYRGRNVVSCLPNGQLKITSLRLAEGEEEIEQAMRKEATQRFGLDPERDAINYIVAGNIQEGDVIKNELILFAADGETIKRHIGILEETQLRPVAIDNVPCALFRSFERSLRRQEDRERTVVFVDIGSRFTTVVFGCGGEDGGDISFIKQIQIGGEKFNREIAAKLGINIGEAEILRDRLRKERSGSRGRLGNVANGDGLDASTRQVITDSVGAVAEELAREISLCFRYYTVTFRGKRVERAVFAGGEAYESILLNVLRRQLPVEIEVAQPLRGFDMINVNFDSDRRGLLCEWAVAVGLSLKGWDGAEKHSKEPEAQ